MADLKIRSDTLDDAVSSMTTVIQAFEQSESFANDVADAVGDGELTGAVQHFGNSWNKKREEMIASATAVRDTLKAINDAFTDADAELAKALDAPPEQSGPTPSAV
ncbi:hypothetical protein ALI44B_00010 [Leifsonia sp. ALI-44-B]|jgi:uncharacterized protein YukE|uniref:hypothetical protein n=1 Tax=Leifsonia sp. ALI-44-B TaxID=1933776 RepID=UPI00097CBB9D|nr:hypothetical protein [Leifsonia sp. ALI-44-B]ONI65449.1 hypothetical protein ALI44B_00010 [Leifsonia sp. ALI-44-B]